ncbi:MAG: hypothetical protein A3F87_03630 [Omnitrophica WOR_2 bacterium RIFCSPLOWO2_12_FULL_51_24]|nr:MAG: hypothetical protein A3I43_01065 [Omnitrophica WOR_2 bacterium RIFCSPLOWO2_02_FULL_50_19]OGX42361.1 MAG: hypothetical protein A3F87_03630 [Omnitrophica WOR_2 bacterium RIFCSPLOWO2_12_FULL_51_24]
MKETSKVIAIVAFVLWLLVMWKSSSVFQSKEVPVQFGEGQEETVAGKEGADVAPDSLSYAERLLKSPFAFSRYQPLINKNIFVKPEIQPELFTPEKLTVISVSAVPLPFMYNGFIEKSDGTRIGQVNWSGKTYFIKKGDKFKDYKVLEINSKIIKIENKDGQIVLEYKKPAKSKELVAKLHNSMDNKEFEVKKNDEVGGYKILDIKADSVVLYGQEKEWVINKGREYK